MSKSQFNYFYDINGDYKENTSKDIENFNNSKIGVSIKKNRLTENFIKVAESKSNTDISKIKNLKETSNKIDRGTVIKGTSKLLSSAINEVANKNTSELNQFITLSNSFEIGKVKTDGDFNLTNFKQKVNVDNTANINAAQKIKNKITNEIARTLSTKIKNVVKSVTDDKDSFEQSSNVGTSVGNMVGDIFGKIGDAMSLSFGGSTSGYTSKEEVNSVKESLELDETFTTVKNREVSDKIQNKLSSENIASCVSKTKSGNAFKIDTMDVGGNVNINEFEQVAAIKNVLSCAFNNEVLNDLASKIIDDFEENISRMSESANKRSIDNKKSTAHGDIQAIGVVGGAILEATGNGVVSTTKGMGEGLTTATEGDGKGVSTAVEGTGKGIATAAKGVGKGISSIFSGLMIPLIIIGVLILIIGGLKMSGKI